MAKEEKEITVFERFSKLQHELRKIGVSSEVNAGAMKYKFVDLLHLRTELDKPFTKYGFFFTQPLEIVEGKNSLATYIYDSFTGQKFLESHIFLCPVKENNPQNVGSDITYLRRYSLFSLLGLVGDKDNDCYYEPEEIQKLLKECNSPAEIKKLYDGIREEQRDEFKDAFNVRIKELKEEQTKSEEEVLSKSEIK